MDIELLFTVGEERMLAGARAFDRTRLRSRFGYVFDHASPIGELVLSAPTHHRLQATFRGAAAHAGVRPEQGRSAILAAARAVADMRLGRIDAHTTANVGTIAGGSAINVVPERCSILAEVRAQREERAEEILAELLDCVHEAANLPECECDVDVTVERTFTGYRTPPSTPAVRAAERALRACGHEPVRIASGGASDANALIAAGLPVVNLANGTERNHEPGERVSAAALEATLEIALALPAAVAAYAGVAARGQAGMCPRDPTRPAPAGVASSRGRNAQTVSTTAASASIESLALDFLAYLELERGLSRNTLEAYRIDLLQFGEFLRRRGLSALEVGHRDLAAFLSELADGTDGASRGRARHAAAQGRLPALLLPAPAPRGAARARSDR